jgi:hypothetical protein
MVDTEVMWRRLMLTMCGVLAGALASAAVPARQEAGRAEVPVDSRPDCIEAVVLARIVEYRPQPIPEAGTDEIVIRWPWDVDIDVREVYLGEIPRGRLTIGAILHTRFDPDLHQPVLFLTRRSGRWYLSYVEFAARGPDGLVIPVFDAVDEAEMSPDGWKPRDFEKWLSPVRYRWRDVKAFGEIYEGDEPDAHWVRAEGKRQFALRGVRAAYLPAMLKERRAVDCVEEKS